MNYKSLSGKTFYFMRFYIGETPFKTMTFKKAAG